jgi:CheY-like chemotaxis protein
MARVLLVEDEISVLMLAESVVQGLGHSTFTASNVVQRKLPEGFIRSSIWAIASRNARALSRSAARRSQGAPRRVRLPRHIP